MFNDEDDDAPVAVDPELDNEIADAEGADEDDEADVRAAARTHHAILPTSDVRTGAGRAVGGRPAGVTPGRTGTDSCTAGPGFIIYRAGVTFSCPDRGL